jgi:hypothetical protein
VSCDSVAVQVTVQPGRLGVGKRLPRQRVTSLATKMTVATSLAVGDPLACRSARGSISSTN